MCCWDVQVSLQQPVLHCRVFRWGLLVLSLSLSLFLFSLPSVSTSSFSILFVFCAAAFSLVCTDLCSGMYSNEGSVIRTSFWCTSQSAPRLRASASKCKACSLLHYCTCYFILLLYNIYSETWVTLQIEIIACWLAVTSDMRSIRWCCGRDTVRGCCLTFWDWQQKETKKH